MTAVERAEREKEAAVKDGRQPCEGCVQQIPFIASGTHYMGESYGNWGQRWPCTSTVRG